MNQSGFHWGKEEERGLQLFSGNVVSNLVCLSTLRSGIVRKAAQAVGEVGSGREQREEQQFFLLGDEQLPEHYQQQQQQRRRRLPEEDEPTGHQLPGVPAAVSRAATSRHQTSAALLHPPWRPAR